MKIKTFGSICSGIEAASYVFNPLGIKSLWLSEIAQFPSYFLSQKYPSTPNLGDMNDIPNLIKEGKIKAPDLLCGGTPCQAFSLAGWKKGLTDPRGQLSLKYIEILDSIDAIRESEGKSKAIFFWENVVGVLTDRTNAFGCFLAGLAGLDEPIEVKKWTKAGFIKGANRNIAWRVLDSKYFGLPQQRQRIYVIGGGKDFNPELALLEIGDKMADPYKAPIKKSSSQQAFNLFPDEDKLDEIPTELVKYIGKDKIEVFRTYSDCLYTAYGTKWNGNAAAFNGSLFVAQNDRLRRLTPMECERLMGFPDDYTNVGGKYCTYTTRYQAAGNSWAVPVIDWIIKRILECTSVEDLGLHPDVVIEDAKCYLLSDFTKLPNGKYLNGSIYKYHPEFANMLDVISVDNVDEKFYISKAGCAGILRRKRTHNAGMNPRLEEILIKCSE